MATETKNKRLQLRVSPEDDSVIRAAAERRSVSMSAYLIESALNRAQTEMADRTVVTLSEESWNAFVADLDSPPVVNEKLARAIERSRAAISASE